MTTRDFDNDFVAIAADDALLDLVTSGRVVESDDEIARLLATWRGELDAAVPATVPDPNVVLPGAPAMRRVGTLGRMRRHTAGITAAAVVIVAGSAGVAAAASGPHGPLGAVNRVLFGAPTGHDDSARLALVRSMLDRVERGIDKAHGRGGASAARLADLREGLSSAGRILAADPAAPSSFIARLAALQADLATLDTLPTPTPVIGGAGGLPDIGSGAGGLPSSGDSSTSGSDDGAGSSSDRSGDTSGSDDGASSDSGGSGSDDGTSTSGDSGTSGSDGGTISGDGGSSGADGGTSTGDGGTSGSDGGTSGSDGDTSSSDGGSSGSDAG